MGKENVLTNTLLVGKVPTAPAGEVDLGRAGQGDVPLLDGSIGPERSIDRIGHQSRIGLVAFDIGEETGFAQLRREAPFGCIGRRRLEFVQTAAVIDDEQFALGVETEAGDLQAGVGQFLVPEDLRAVVADAPDFAGREIAVDIGPFQIGIFLAVIDDAAGQRRDSECGCSVVGGVIGSGPRLRSSWNGWLPS